METKILKKYEIRVESNTVGNGEDSDAPVIMNSVYSEDGGYCGPMEEMHHYFEKGIFPELISPDHKTCSIGKSHIDGKWYGWSHRAMFGFQIGDVVKEGDCTASEGFTDEYLAKHPEERSGLPVGFEAKTEEDAKKMAIAFAKSVS